MSNSIFDSPAPPRPRASVRVNNPTPAQTIAVVLGAIVSVSVLLALTAIWVGFVFSTMWGWFVAPVTTLPEIGIAEAIGLSITIHLFTNRTAVNQNAETGAKVMGLLLYPLYALFFGWIVLQFI
jgi:hypothetical protein